MLGKMIDIIKSLRKLHSFNVLMALLSGINSTAIRRLEHTFVCIDRAWCTDTYYIPMLTHIV